MTRPITTAFEPLPDGVNDLTERIIGCAMAVHRALGPGMVEKVYSAAMQVELQLNDMPFETERAIPIVYREIPIGIHRLDLIVAEQVVVELKSIQMLDFVHKIQVLSYLRASKLRVGLLINFNVVSLRHGIRRLVL